MYLSTDCPCLRYDALNSSPSFKSFCTIVLFIMSFELITPFHFSFHFISIESIKHLSSTLTSFSRCDGNCKGQGHKKVVKNQENWTFGMSSFQVQW